MDDEIRQDESDGQMDAISDVADTEEPMAQSESAIAGEPREDVIEEEAASVGQEAPGSVDATGAPAQESPMDSAETAPDAAASGPDETTVTAEPPGPVPAPESAMEPVIEAIAESAADPSQAEPMPEEGDQMAMAETEVLTAETSETEAEVSQAPAMVMEAQPQVEDTGSEAVPAVAAEADDDRHWYVVHCYSGYENKVRHNLEQRIESMGMKDKIFDVVVPTEEEIEVKEGKRRTVERRVFPGYILVQMIMTEESWYVVRNTPGVTGFVGMGNEPTPLRPEEVAQIIRRMEAEAPRVKVTYKIDQKVRIIDGPFNDFIGTVDDIDMERAKVRVMVSFFGRETPVELDFLQVEKA
jgi:transcriptional antiterminator NusG